MSYNQRMSNSRFFTVDHILQDKLTPTEKISTQKSSRDDFSEVCKNGPKAKRTEAENQGDDAAESECSDTSDQETSGRRSSEALNLAERLAGTIHFAYITNFFTLFYNLNASLDDPICRIQFSSDIRELCLIPFRLHYTPTSEQCYSIRK